MLLTSPAQVVSICKLELTPISISLVNTKALTYRSHILAVLLHYPGRPASLRSTRDVAPHGGALAFALLSLTRQPPAWKTLAKIDSCHILPTRALPKFIKQSLPN